MGVRDLPGRHAKTRYCWSRLQITRLFHRETNSEIAEQAGLLHPGQLLKRKCLEIFTHDVRALQLQESPGLQTRGNYGQGLSLHGCPNDKGFNENGRLLQESAMTYVYGLLAAQAVNPGKNIVGNNGVALMLQKSFVEKVEDRIRADNGVDNILELYERTLKHSTSIGTLTVHERITKIPSYLKILRSS